MQSPQRTTTPRRLFLTILKRKSTVPKWVPIVWPKTPAMPQKISLQNICPSTKALDFWKKLSLDVRSPWFSPCPRQQRENAVYSYFDIKVNLEFTCPKVCCKNHITFSQWYNTRIRVFTYSIRVLVESCFTTTFWNIMWIIIIIKNTFFEFFSTFCIKL